MVGTDYRNADAESKFLDRESDIHGLFGIEVHARPLSGENLYLVGDEPINLEIAAALPVVPAKCPDPLFQNLFMRASCWVHAVGLNSVVRKDKSMQPIIDKKQEPAWRIRESWRLFIAQLREVSPARWAVVLIVFNTLLSLWYAAHLQLVPDEAYYWLWSVHPDWSYRDKGPVVAWMIYAGTWLFGSGELGVRWIGVLCGAGTSWQIFLLARRLFDERTALWCVVLALITPLFAIGSILITIDTFSVFFWAWGCNLFLDGLAENSRRDWLLLGLAVGLGFLSKFTNAMQFVSIALFALWYRPACPLLTRPWKNPGLIYSSLVFLLCCLPLLYWDYAHHWPHYVALHSRSGLDQGFQFRPGELLKYLVDQGMALSPLLFIGLLGALAGGFWLNRQSYAIRFLLSMTLPLIVTVLFFSLSVAGKGNWIAPGLVTGLILMVVIWRQWSSASRWLRAAALLGLSLALAETVVLHNTSWLSPVLKKDPLSRVKGWREMSREVLRQEMILHPDFIICNHYGVASELAFYLPEQPVKNIFTATSASMDNQFYFWPGYAGKIGYGTRAFYVTDDADHVNPVFYREFDKVSLAGDFTIKERGFAVRRVQIYLLQKGKVNEL
jgi:hypothetical protein